MTWNVLTSSPPSVLLHFEVTRLYLIDFSAASRGRFCLNGRNLASFVDEIRVSLHFIELQSTPLLSDSCPFIKNGCFMM